MNALSRTTLAVLLLAGVSAARAEVALPPFYAAASKLTPEGKLGQVLKKEPVATSVAGAKAWRIVYVSSDVAGRKTLSTALVVAPAGKAPRGGRPLLAWAHGTTGTAQNCGPSQVIDPAAPLNQYFLVGGNSWTDYGIPGVEAFIQAGYVVVATDYQGLGGGGRHQYAVAATNARDVVDSARAARSMKEVGAGSKTMIYGWSQGGGATIAAASMPDYLGAKGTAADDLQFVGFVALAPDDVAVMVPEIPKDEAGADKVIGGFIELFSDNVFNFAHLAMNLWGTQAAYPGLALTDVFTEQGAKVIDDVLANKCMHVAADTIGYAYGTQYRTLLQPRPGNTLAWVRAFANGSVPPVKPVAPVIIFWGTKDTAVPPVMHELYQRQMCAMGANVERIQLPGEQTHYSTPGVSAPLYVPWVKDRMAGKPVANGCPPAR